MSIIGKRWYLIGISGAPGLQKDSSPHINTVTFTSGMKGFTSQSVSGSIFFRGFLFQLQHIQVSAHSPGSTRPHGASVILLPHFLTQRYVVLYSVLSTHLSKTTFTRQCQIIPITWCGISLNLNSNKKNCSSAYLLTTRIKLLLV
jgi:hypothetical protein